jgi:acyl transferase domain-containing protein
MTAKNASRNGHIPQLKPEQQLVLSRIQKRLLQYQVQASQHTEEARKLVDQARAVDLEFQKALQDMGRRLGVDLNAVLFDFDKLQFTKKEAEGSTEGK